MKIHRDYLEIFLRDEECAKKFYREKHRLRRFVNLMYFLGETCMAPIWLLSEKLQKRRENE